MVSFVQVSAMTLRSHRKSLGCAGVLADCPVERKGAAPEQGSWLCRMLLFFCFRLNFSFTQRSLVPSPVLNSCVTQWNQFLYCPFGFSPSARTELDVLSQKAILSFCDVVWALVSCDSLSRAFQYFINMSYALYFFFVLQQESAFLSSGQCNQVLFI